MPITVWLYRWKEKIFLPPRTKHMLGKNERIVTHETAVEILPQTFRDTFRQAAERLHTLTVLCCGIRISSRNTRATVSLSRVSVTPTLVTFSGSSALLLSLSSATTPAGPMGQKTYMPRSRTEAVM